MNDQITRKTQIGSHRGLSAAYPDNTLGGIVAASLVADFVELDVRRTADGEIVLSHDPAFGDVVINDRKWDELRDIDLGSGHHPALFGQVLEALPDTPLDIEIKNFPDQPGFDPVGEFAIDVAGLARPLDVVTSFFWPTMDIVKAALPEVRTGLLVFQGGTVADVMAAALDGGHEVVAPHFSLLVDDRDLITQAQQAGLEVISWTVNDIEVARALMEAGIDGLITDHPELMKQEQQ